MRLVGSTNSTDEPDFAAVTAAAIPDGVAP